MKKLLSFALLAFFLFSLVLQPLNVGAMENTPCKNGVITKAMCELKSNQRKLWIDHVFWTRDYIKSDLSSLEDKEVVLNKLLQNQDNIGNLIKPYYGEEAGNKLSQLLREHIELAGKVVDAAKSKNKEDLEKFNKLWYQNADQIADFLSSANPNYSNKELKDMLYTHLKFVTDQVVARLNKDFKGDIKAFDKGEDHMIMFADMLTKGIIKQFPEKFK